MNDHIATAAPIFTGKAEAYARGRPGYAGELLRWIESVTGAHSRQRIADIGCGTGQLATLFVQAGYGVDGVEPAADMLASAAQKLAATEKFSPHSGTAEATGLISASVDGVVVGTAFHWFDRAATQAEFARILRPNGWVALIANERDPRTAADHAFEKLLEHFRNDADPRMRELDDCAPIDFLGSHAQRQVWPTTLKFDCAAFAALVWSRSYMPREGNPRYAEAQAAIAATFAAHALVGEIDLSYRTVAYAVASFKLIDRAWAYE